MTPNKISTILSNNWHILKCNSIKPIKFQFNKNSNNTMNLFLFQFSQHLHHQFTTLHQCRDKRSNQLPKKICTNSSSKLITKMVHMRTNLMRFLIILGRESHSWLIKKLKRECRSIWLFSEKKSIEISMSKSIKIKDILLITKMQVNLSTSRSKSNWLSKNKLSTKECLRLSIKSISISKTNSLSIKTS